MFKLLTSAMLLTVAVVGDALAFAVVPASKIGGGMAGITLAAVPAPEIGGGMLGIMLATGVVYLVNRRRSRS